MTIATPFERYHSGRSYPAETVPLKIVLILQFKPKPEQFATYTISISLVLFYWTATLGIIDNTKKQLQYTVFTFTKNTRVISERLMNR